MSTPYSEIIKRAILSGKTYEELPSRIQSVLPVSEWRTLVKESCIQQGQQWQGSLASTVCMEQDYYEVSLEEDGDHATHVTCKASRQVQPTSGTFVAGLAQILQVVDAGKRQQQSHPLCPCTSADTQPHPASRGLRGPHKP